MMGVRGDGGLQSRTMIVQSLTLLHSSHSSGSLVTSYFKDPTQVAHCASAATTARPQRCCVAPYRGSPKVL